MAHGRAPRAAWTSKGARVETKAHHVLIGGLVLVFTAAFFGFMIWLARIDVNKATAIYDIYFSSSVAGLGVGGDVRFNGIKVGEVKDITIDRKDPRNVRVRVEIDGNTPIRADSIAELNLQGITGVSYVMINPGTPDATLLKPGSSPPPIIPSRPSRIAELFQGAPDLLNRLISLTDRTSAFLSPENEKSLTAILADLRDVTGAISARKGEIQRIIDSTDTTMLEVSQAAKTVREMSSRLDRVSTEAETTMVAIRKASGDVGTIVNGDLRSLIVETRQSVNSFDGLAKSLDGMVRENREPIRVFTSDGLAEFRRLVEDTRILVANLSRVASRLEDNPSEIFFGIKDPEFRPGGRQ